MLYIYLSIYVVDRVLINSYNRNGDIYNTILINFNYVMKDFIDTLPQI